MVIQVYSPGFSALDCSSFPLHTGATKRKISGKSEIGNKEMGNGESPITSYDV